MLFFTRRCGQKVRIETNDGVIVIEVRKQGHKVSLGFDAPKHIKILRDELPTRNDVALAPLELTQEQIAMLKQVRVTKAAAVQP